MRQFLLGGNVAYTDATDFLAIASGALGVYYLDNGEIKVTADGSDITDKGMLVLGRPSTMGGPVVLPIFKNDFTVVKMVYKAATRFAATIAVPAPTEKGSYSIIVTKKGTVFNERNNYTAETYVANTSTSAVELAQKLVDSINGNNSGVSATLAGTTITITADEAGKDFAVVGADGLMGATVTVTTAGVPGYGGASYIIDLANKAAADAGFEYTYREADLYPSYPLNPLAQSNAEDKGFTIFTIRFAEPREMRTVETVVHQIVQVALPTGSAQIATLETIFNTLAE